MRVLYITNRAEIFSGGQISLLEFLSRVDRSRFEPIVLCPGEGEIAKKVREMGIPVLIWDMPTARTFDLKRTFGRIKKLRDLIKKHEVDIVHANGNRAQFYASLAIKGTRAKLIWHVRESTPDHYLYDWFVSSSASRIICVSHGAMKKRFSRFPGIERKIKVIYNGVDAGKFKKDASARERVRAEFKISQDDILLGLIGLLIPRKGHQILLKSMSMLAGDHPKLKLLIMGETIDAAYTNRLKTMTKQLGIDNNVIFSAARKDIEAVLSALDMFVLPSQGEGFSRALIEAMSSSLPVIASDIEGNNEAVTQGETGFLVPYGEVYLLAEDIQKLIENRELSEEMGEKARKRVEEFFSLKKHVREVEGIYNELKEQG
jgi:glycosyltransferase involved in cell wall biosynthesis